MKNENKRKYGHGNNRKNERLVMRMTNNEDTKLNDLVRYLGKSKSDVMRDALDMLYQSEGGDEIRNKAPKNANTYISLSNSDLEKLNDLSRDLGESSSDVIRKAINLFKIYNELD